MPHYRKTGIRLVEDVKKELSEAVYPGPNIEKMGDYAQRRQQLKAVHSFDKAHTVMLAEEKVISCNDAKAILNELNRMEEQDIINVRYTTGGGIHSGEEYLTNKIGESIAGRLHTGRSSGDLNEVSCRLTLREKLLKIQDELLSLIAEIIITSDRHKETVMPGYSHLRHAQPTTFAHYLLSWVCAFERDVERGYELYKRVNQSPAGAAILTGTDFPINRYRTAELLGFDNICINTRDAIWNRDYLIEAFYLLSVMGNNIARFADDLQLWSTSEYQMLDLADGYCGTSSIMPQKKNPYALEHLRAESAQHLANFVQILAVMKAPSDAVVLLDLQKATANLWRSLDDTIYSIKLIKGIIKTLTINNKVMYERAGEFWSQASDLAGVLVREKNLSWRTAHQIIGIVVRIALEKGLRPIDVKSYMIDEAAQQYLGRALYLPEEILQKALDPKESIKARKNPGGPAPERVEEELSIHRGNLKRNMEFLHKLNKRINEAEEALTKAVGNIIKTF